MAFKKRAGRKHITTPDGRDVVAARAPRIDSSMIRAVVRGHELLELMDADPDLTTVKLGKEQKLDASYVAKYVRIPRLCNREGFRTCHHIHAATLKEGPNISLQTVSASPFVVACRA